MDELKLVERLRSEVPEDIDVTGAENRWRRRAYGSPGRRAYAAPARRRRPLLLSGVAAAACAGVVATFLVGHEDARPMANVAAVLDKAADQAADDPVPRADQFVYQESVTRHRVGGVGRWYETRHRTWDPVGGQGGGLVIEKNSIRPRPGEVLPPEDESIIGPCRDKAPIDRPYLGDLPTDTGELLDLLARQGEGDRSDRQWNAVTDRIDRPAPPKVRAALFRAIAEIPGVRLRDDGVDAVGRHGVAVARTDDDVRDEIIFDRASHRFLGTRTVVAGKGHPFGPPGTSNWSTALLTSKIVDRAPRPGPDATPSDC
ncbi:CU044_5270 family protein [Actinomadura sp. NPDC000600]|uniref:CU044_5270 family protein n=1 Tax=Actinomadura sp. NPDC000600 TaxID=3154262 RepID=UPI00339B5641